VTGSKILRILKVAGLAPELPEDLYHLIKKVITTMSTRMHTLSCYRWCRQHQSTGAIVHMATPWRALSATGTASVRLDQQRVRMLATCRATAALDPIRTDALHC